MRKETDMKVLAITRNGQEFIYNAKSAHRVVQNKAKYVLDVLNKYRYLLKDDSEKWFIYDVDEYDKAYAYSAYHRFSVSKTGVVKDTPTYSYYNIWN